MYVHPIENVLHIIYILEIQRLEPLGNLISGRHQIRLMKINRQGNILSDDLIFDCAVGPPAGTPLNGVYSSQSAHLKYFYKSTSPTEFIPYFNVITRANDSGDNYSRVFKYTNGAYAEIYSTPAGFKPYYSNTNSGTASFILT